MLQSCPADLPVQVKDFPLRSAYKHKHTPWVSQSEFHIEDFNTSWLSENNNIKETTTLHHSSRIPMKGSMPITSKPRMVLTNARKFKLSCFRIVENLSNNQNSL